MCTYVCLLLTQALQSARVTPQQLQMVLQQRLSLPSAARLVSAPGVQSLSRLPNNAVRGSVASGMRPSFAAAFTKTLSASPHLAGFKAPLPPPNAAALPKTDKRKYDTLRLVKILLFNWPIFL